MQMFQLVALSFYLIFRLCHAVNYLLGLIYRVEHYTSLFNTKKNNCQKFNKYINCETHDSLCKRRLILLWLSVIIILIYKLRFITFVEKRVVYISDFPFIDITLKKVGIKAVFVREAMSVNPRLIPLTSMVDCIKAEFVKE